MKKIRMKKIMLFLLLLFFGMVQVLPVYAEESETKLDLYAQSAVLLDADTGRILYSKNGEKALPMASTTKIMTCIVALENGNLEDEVTVSSYAAGMPRVKLGMRSGETYLLKDLLYSLMLESHNDSAVAIAEHISGSVEAFAKLMNQKARDIGCFQTYFITPNGLDATTTITRKNGETEVKVHSTTAEELAKIMAYCIKKSPQKEKFLEITRTPQYSFTSGNRTFSCNNHNAFLSMMEGALSGKTGFTGNAGYCYVGALERENKSFVVALLACGWPNNKTYKWSDTKKLMSYGIENYEYSSFQDVLVDKRKLQPIKVLDGQTKEIGQEAYMPVKVLPTKENDREGLLLRKDEKIEIVYEMEKELQAPIDKGRKVGSITYVVNEEPWKVLSVVTMQKIEKIDYKWCVLKVWEKYLT